MDPNKAEIKNIGNKLTEEHESSNTNDMSKELESLNKLNNEKKELPVIKIKEHDIELLKRELDITYDEAKLQLIKFQGDVKKVIEDFLNRFNFE